jgi:hypothetical protein
LRAVPYINSVPNALAQIEAKGVATAAYYQKSMELAAKVLDLKNSQLKNQGSTIKDREARIERYNYALSSYTSDLREVGLIIDPRDPNNITLFISPSYKVTDGMTGWIFRYDDNFIGSIQFKQKGADITATAKDIAAGKSISPFDKILLQVESPEALQAQQSDLSTAPADTQTDQTAPQDQPAQNAVQNGQDTQKGGQ